MRSRPAALITSVFLIAGALSISGCDDAQPSQGPGVEEQEDAENQENGEGQDDEGQDGGGDDEEQDAEDDD